MAIAASACASSRELPEWREYLPPSGSVLTFLVDDPQWPFLAVRWRFEIGETKFDTEGLDYLARFKSDYLQSGDFHGTWCEHPGLQTTSWPAEGHFKLRRGNCPLAFVNLWHPLSLASYMQEPVVSFSVRRRRFGLLDIQLIDTAGSRFDYSFERGRGLVGAVYRFKDFQTVHIRPE